MAKQQGSQLEPWSDLSNKVVFVTGASSGIGRGICLDLARAGCKIIAAARRVDRLKSLCDEINSITSSLTLSSTLSMGTISPHAVPLELDVSADGPTIEKSVQKAWNAFGRIDALINSAGLRGNVNSSLDTPEEEWNQVLTINLKGSWLVSNYVCICMRDANRAGSVINISSIAGLDRGQLPGGVAYASSKAAINNVTKTMALELGKHKIRVNSISPGLFKSEITEQLMQKKWLDNVVNRVVPLRALGGVDPAITSLVRYLIHDSSEYVSGNIFILDAGYTLPGVPIFSSL